MTRTCLAVLALTIGGCVEADPYRRPDVWYPTGVNSGNIAAMVAKPRDMIVGRGVNETDARQAVGGIDRIWLDGPRVLPKADAAPAAGAAAPGGQN